MKIVPTCGFKKDGSKFIKAYKLTIKKTECEKYGFDENTEFEAEYFEDKIVLKKIN